MSKFEQQIQYYENVSGLKHGEKGDPDQPREPNGRWGSGGGGGSSSAGNKPAKPSGGGKEEDRKPALRQAVKDLDPDDFKSLQHTFLDGYGALSVGASDMKSIISKMADGPGKDAMNAELKVLNDALAVLKRSQMGAVI